MINDAQRALRNSFIRVCWWCWIRIYDLGICPLLRVAPAEIIQKLNRAMIQAMNTDQVQKTFASIGAEYIGSSPQELKKYLGEETAKWQKIISETGISVD